MLTQYFNFQRFASLLTMDLYLAYRACFYYGLGIIVLALLFPNVFHFKLLLIYGGILLTSYAFHSLSDPNRAVWYFTIPGSTFEKWLSQLFFTTIGFAATLLFLLSISLFLNKFFINFLDFRVHSIVDFPSIQDIKWALFLYLPINAVFLLGAILFRRYVIIKTVISLLLILIVLSKTIFPLLLKSMMNFKDYINLTGDALNLYFYGFVSASFVIFLLICYSVGFYFLRRKEATA